MYFPKREIDIVAYTKLFFSLLLMKIMKFSLIRILATVIY